MLLYAPLFMFALWKNDDDESTVAELAAVLEAEESGSAVQREVERLAERIDETYSSAKRDLDPPQRVAADAGPKSKVDAIRTAVQSSRSADGGTAARTAAVNLRDEVQPQSVTGQRLLDQLAGVRGSNIEETLSTVVEKLDEHEQAQSELERLDGPDSVSEPASAYRDRTEDHRRSDEKREQLTDAVDRLLDELDIEREGDDNDLTRAVRRATRELRDCDASNGDGGLGAAVSGARSEHTPRSRQARELYETVEAGATDEATNALVDAAERLDRAATTESLTGGIDPNDVETMATEVESTIASHDGAVAETLGDRVTELRKRLQRIDGSNRVVPFAVREELTFYQDHLIESIDAGTADPAVDGDAVALRSTVDELRNRRDRVQTNYVEERSDHNHSIPLYFLSLVDTSLEDAETHLDAGNSAEADGALSVTEDLLDHVEGLYERNQYSVMLRSLRG
ncbi:hypothetical protein JCM17823_07190 [Halorubrum gandharaense]